MPRILLLLVLFAAIAVQAAERRVLLIHEDSAVARQATDVLVVELGRQGIPEGAVHRLDVAGLDGTAIGRLRQEGFNTAVVAIGAKALRPSLQLGGPKPIVAALLSRLTVEEGGMPIDRIHAIVLDQPVDRLLNLVQVAMPGVRQLGVLAGPTGQRPLRVLDRKAQDRRLTVTSELVSSSDEVVAALERLAPKMHALLAFPDSMVHNRNTVQPLLLTTYRAGIPVVAYSESYLQAGAVLALYSTPMQIAQQTAEAVAQILDGQGTSGIHGPRYFTVGVNAAVAKSLGLTMPSPLELQDRLRSLE